jgi:hypothetical protein
MKRTSKRHAYWGPTANPNLGTTVIYETIRAYKSLSGGNLPTSLYVNKIPVLTALELERAGVPVPLPFAWYKFGPEVERPPYQVRYSHAPKSDDAPEEEDGAELDHEYRTLVDWRGEPPNEGSADEITETIHQKVLELTVRFVGPGKSERLVDRAYELAPFDFQRKFRLARINIGRTGRGSEFESVARSSDLGTLVLDAFKTFPAEEFPTLEVGATATQRLVNYAWNRLGRRDMYAATDILEQFWSAFASCLRANPVGHSAACPNDLVEEWEELAQRDTERFTRAAGDIAIRLARTDSDLRRDDLISAIADARESQRSIGDREIDDALQDAEEIESILSNGSGMDAGE